MKKLVVCLMLLMISTSAFAMASRYKAPTNVDSFYKCLNNVNKVTCDYTQYDWVSDPTASDKFYACYTPARAKCGCDNNIAAECK